MRRFVIKFLTIVLFFTYQVQVFSSERVYLIPVDSIDSSKSYSKEDLQHLFLNFSNSYDGRAAWGQIKSGDIKELSNGISLPTIGESSAKHDWAASCYRCALAKTDIVKKEDCIRRGLKWDLRELQLIKQSCN